MGKTSSARRRPALPVVGGVAVAAGLAPTAAAASPPEEPPAASAPAAAEPAQPGAQPGPPGQVSRQFNDLASAHSSRPAAAARRPERVQAFLDDMSRMGRNYSTAQLVEHTVADPLVGDITVVAPLGYTPVEVESASVVGEANRTGLGVAMAETGPVADALPSSGLGFNAGINPSGIDYKGGACATQYFDPAYSHTSDHRLSTCWEKWKSQSDYRWIYNRWAYWTRGTPSARYAATLDFTIRSRPWRGYESRVTGMTGHTAPQPNNACSTVMNVGISAGPASISVPVHRCGGLSTREDFNRHSGGIDWNGKTTSQLYLDFAMAVTTTPDAPVFADYAWMEVCDSLTSSSCSANPSQYLVRADSGW